MAEAPQTGDKFVANDLIQKLPTTVKEQLLSFETMTDTAIVERYIMNGTIHIDALDSDMRSIQNQLGRIWGDEEYVYYFGRFITPRYEEIKTILNDWKPDEQ